MTERRMYLASSREEPSEQSKNVIPGFEQLTPQEVFDISASHLLKQGKRSVKPGTNQCMYRGPDGMKCAAGVFLTDNFAINGHAEGCSWHALTISANGVPKTNEGLITQLQLVHDGAAEWIGETGIVEKWEIVIPALKRLAADFNLEWKYDNVTAL